MPGLVDECLRDLGPADRREYPPNLLRQCPERLKMGPGAAADPEKVLVEKGVVACRSLDRPLLSGIQLRELAQIGVVGGDGFV